MTKIFYPPKIFVLSENGIWSSHRCNWRWWKEIIEKLIKIEKQIKTYFNVICYTYFSNNNFAGVDACIIANLDQGNQTLNSFCCVLKLLQNKTVHYYFHTTFLQEKRLSMTDFKKLNLINLNFRNAKSRLLMIVYRCSTSSMMSLVVLWSRWITNLSFV